MRKLKRKAVKAAFKTILTVALMAGWTPIMLILYLKVLRINYRMEKNRKA